MKCDKDFYESAYAFGNFQSLLADYPAHTLYEIIKDFHHIKKRFERFKELVNVDIVNHVKDVQHEIQFVLDHEYLAHILIDKQASGELPLRVTHNDTKLNNVLIDKDTHKGICVIDMDTIMSGLSVNDFGASTGAEDEKDLSKVECDMHLF